MPNQVETAVEEYERRAPAIPVPEPGVHISVVDEPLSDEGWTIIGPAERIMNYSEAWVEVGRWFSSGYVRYDDEKSGSQDYQLPIGYRLYSFRVSELSKNGDVHFDVSQRGPDGVRVTYRVASEGSFIDRRRGWLVLLIHLRGLRIDTGPAT